MTWKLGLFMFASLLPAGTIIDQIAVVVGRHAIKTSDIERDLRVTQFLNGQAPDFGTSQKRAAVQRLIDQELIRSELVQEGVEPQLASETKSVLDQLRADRFHGSDAEMKAELLRHGLTMEQLIQQLEWQMTVLSFIDQRFRPGVIVDDGDIRSYYDQHQAELKRQYPKDNTLEALTPRIRETIEGDHINRNFEEWLQHARESTHIEFKLDELK
jgi:hypothetical protein